MPGQLRIATSTIHTAERPFRIVVEVSGARPNDRVVVRLWQTAGVRPYFDATAPAVIDANGDGLAILDDVVLHGPNSIARLIADDEESAVPLRADEVHIEVLP